MLSCKVGNTLINSIDYQDKDLRSWSKRKLLKCPVCNESVVYRNGLIKMPHFAHEKDTDCTYNFYENESKEHASGKVLLYKVLKRIDSIGNLKLEAYIPETKQRPDMYFELGTQRYVIEYQCSPLLLSEFKERRELYKLAGIKDIWIFGTEKYNYTSAGKLKMKAAENDWFTGEQRLYYLNPFEETLYKFYRCFDFETRYPVVSISLNQDFNFNIENRELSFGNLEYKQKQKNNNLPILPPKYRILAEQSYVLTNTINFKKIPYIDYNSYLITFNPGECLSIEKLYFKFNQLKYFDDVIVYLPLASEARLRQFEGLFDEYGIKLNISRGKIKVFSEPKITDYTIKRMVK